MKHCKPKLTNLFGMGEEHRIARRRVPLEEGERKEALGIWERVYDTYSGELIGFRMAARRDDRDVRSIEVSDGGIGAAEIEVNCDKSRTEYLNEWERQQLIKSGKPPEDFAERTHAKVFVFPRVGAAKKDILRAWPA